MEEIVLRYYQKEAIEKCISDLLHGHDPVIALPTGSGKSIVLCGLAEEIINIDSKANVLIVSHVQEILEQNHSAVTKYFGGYEWGLYSSGLDSRTIKKITVAGIQSIQNRPEEFKHFTHVIIDEAHRVGFEQNTGYRKFLKQIDAQCIGLTATPFRMKGGYIYEGEKALFNKLSIDLTSGDRFTRLIEEGYLSEIYSKKTVLTLDDNGIKTLGGDFATKDLSKKFDRNNITEAAVLECIHFGKNYHHWLCFAIDIKHAENIAERFNFHGIPAVAVHSKMKGREEAIEAFRAGKYRVLVNVDILTTGFDFPGIDMIIMLRHTKSPIIHVQTTGRGLRVLQDKEKYDLNVKEGRLEAIENSKKTHCLVLDFAGNAKRLGPINNVKVRKSGERSRKGEIFTKTCPECQIENYLPATVCCNCGHEFVTKEKIQHSASEVELVQKKKPKKKKQQKKIYGWADVGGVSYKKYSKNGKDLALVVTYKCGMLSYSEYVFVEGNGFGKYKALNWISQRWSRIDIDPPKTVDECLSYQSYIQKPKSVLLDATGKYTKVLDSKF
ncbi:MAG: DEAD/DEAH box helicase [Actinomycetia bacterium]|nr:DEAD/DEAH box helicase [Actinomycetes bacterium]